MTDMQTVIALYYKQGYNLALEHAHHRFPAANAHPAFIGGFNEGLKEVYASVPRIVHTLLGLVPALEPSMDFAFTTPPLNSFGRRSVHIILRPYVQRKQVSISLVGSGRYARLRVVHRALETRAPKDGPQLRVEGAMQDKECGSVFILKPDAKKKMAAAPSINPGVTESDLAQNVSSLGRAQASPCPSSRA